MKERSNAGEECAVVVVVAMVVEGWAEGSAKRLL